MFKNEFSNCIHGDQLVSRMNTVLPYFIYLMLFRSFKSTLEYILFLKPIYAQITSPVLKTRPSMLRWVSGRTCRQEPFSLLFLLSYFIFFQEIEMHRCCHDVAFTRPHIREPLRAPEQHGVSSFSPRIGNPPVLQTASQYCSFPEKFWLWVSWYGVTNRRPMSSDNNCGHRSSPK